MKTPKTILALLMMSTLFICNGINIFAQSLKQEAQDPLIWLETKELKKKDIESLTEEEFRTYTQNLERVNEWVKTQDEMTMAEFESEPEYQEFLTKAEEILNAEDRIPLGDFRNGYVYNFWQDRNNKKGTLRRATYEEYKENEPDWEILLDVDKLAQKEGEDWVYNQSYTSCLPPEYTRCLIGLSRSGGDAVVVREYDLESKSFVKGGFSLPEFKSRFEWIDENNIVIGTDFGEGSLTKSEYPRILKKWTRGTPMEEAEQIFEGKFNDVWVSPHYFQRPEGGLLVLLRAIEFYNTEKWAYDNNTGNLTLIKIPTTSRLYAYFKGYLLFIPQENWTINGTTFKQGTLLAATLEDLNSESPEDKIKILYEPSPKVSIKDVSTSESSIIVDILDNVRGKIFEINRSLVAGEEIWETQEIELPQNGSTGIISVNDFTDVVAFSWQNFLNPYSLYITEMPSVKVTKIKALPHKFDSSNLVVKQNEVLSKDGTKVPYFIVYDKRIKFNGTTPTILWGYGGFKLTYTPRYSEVLGKFWLSKGGAYVMSNIRGGGEFGPAWHQAARLEKRQNSYDDFLAVAEDLINKKITSSKHLGIWGGSNGGLLVGVAFTQRPDLFNAVVCSNPLLDMIRYTKLPPGASWMSEYGDPEDEDMRKVILGYSPYQNLKKERKYPKVLFLTSSKDDRVHPGHARKMAYKMIEMGYPVYFYETTTGGHSSASDNYEKAKNYALEYSYVLKMLK